MSTLTRLTLAVVILSGLAIRLPHLSDPPLEFHPTRQYRSALIARGYIADRLPGLSEAERLAVKATTSHSAIEPPIFEHAAAAAYLAAGREALWMPRLMGVAAWMAGALAMWALVAPGTAPLAGLAAVALYLFIPFGVPASQAFQPDGPMTALIAAALALCVHYSRAPSIRRALLALAVSATAVFVKPMAAVFILPVALVVGVPLGGWARSLPRFAAWLALVVAPAAAWYVFAAPAAIEGRFFPQLLTRGIFWTDWLRMIDRVVTWPLALAAVFGLAAAGGVARRALLGAWAGYFALGLLLSHHIHTHDYYSLPLIVLVAWSIGAGMAAHEIRRPVLGYVLAFAVLTLLVALAWRNPPYRYDPRSRLEAANYERIGRIVNHSTRVLSLDGNYGLPLAYHGLMGASNLPLSIDNAVFALDGQSPAPVLERVTSGGAEFFVATVQAELDGQPALRDLLNQRYTLIDRDGSAERWRYLVYDLRRLRFSVTPDQLSAFTQVGAPEGPGEDVALWTPETAKWRVRVSEPGLLRVDPVEGRGPAHLRVTPLLTPPAVDRLLTVEVVGEGQESPSAVFKVRVRAVPVSQESKPFGYVDAPSEPVVLGAGPVLLQGWALDDLSLRRVSAAYTNAAGSLVPIADAVRGGMRPDVAAAHPNASDIYRSAWALTVHASDLPAAPRPLTLLVFAEDSDGLRSELGRRTIR